MLVVGEHVVNVEPERASCLFGQPAEESEDLVPPVVVAAERPHASHVPGHVVGEQLRERSQVSLGKGVIAPAGQFDVWGVRS